MIDMGGIVNIADDILALAELAMKEQFTASFWFTSAPASVRSPAPRIATVGIEQRVVSSLEGNSGLDVSHTAPFLIGETKVGGNTIRLALQLEFGRTGLIIE